MTWNRESLAVSLKRDRATVVQPAKPQGVAHDVLAKLRHGSAKANLKSRNLHASREVKIAMMVTAAKWSVPTPAIGSLRIQGWRKMGSFAKMENTTSSHNVSSESSAQTAVADGLAKDALRVAGILMICSTSGRCARQSALNQTLFL
jgi:hypothetical protein